MIGFSGKYQQPVPEPTFWARSSNLQKSEQKLALGPRVAPVGYQLANILNICSSVILFQINQLTVTYRCRWLTTIVPSILMNHKNKIAGRKYFCHHHRHPHWHPSQVTIQLVHRQLNPINVNERKHFLKIKWEKGKVRQTYNESILWGQTHSSCWWWPRTAFLQEFDTNFAKT